MTTENAPDLPTVRAALLLAGRAPSVHNTQPWHWMFDGARLHLHSDADRTLPFADPLGRQLVISCGAALDHARTAFASMGWHADLTRFPDLDDPRYLAIVEFRPWSRPPDTLAARARAIAHRYTDRLPMLAPEGWAELVPALRDLVAAHDVDVDAVAIESRPRLAAASQHAEALHYYDMAHQAELRWWTGHSNVRHGIPAAALVSNSEAARVDVARTFPASPPSARRADLTDESRILILSTPGESPSHWLRTGEALSTTLLECTVRGLATCSLTHITEMPASRAAISGLVPRPGVPQVLVRIGTAPEQAEPTPTPRRSLAEVFDVRPA